MKTHSPKQQEIKRDWYLIDVKDKTLGKVATKIADILRGKNKPIFSPHIDCGDYIVVINASQIKLTGNKEVTKKYIKHSQYPGGLKIETAEQMLEKAPTKILEKAIYGMLPKNKLRNNIMKKMKIYPGNEHKNQAQNPQLLEI